jgi:trehalose 6-phosphate phosphatase
VDALPGLLADSDAADAFVEHKGLAVSVHTRRLPEPQAALDRLLPVLTAAASDRGLEVEPGRQVIEIRGPGMHKGDAVRAIRAETGADAVLFAGDDLGDVEAFKAVAAIRDDGSPGLLVCSGSEEQRALVELSDIVVDGPDGVLRLLARFAADVRAHAR